MIVVHHDDIFAIAPDVEVLVNPVNTKGVMGAGLAAQIKTRFPSCYEAYQAACWTGMSIGQVVFSQVTEENGPRFIAHLPTKEHWENPSQIDYVRRGLQALRAELKSRGLKVVAMPALGCGLGGLAWEEVEALIRTMFKREDVLIHLYAPKLAATDDTQHFTPTAQPRTGATVFPREPKEPPVTDTTAQGIGMDALIEELKTPAEEPVMEEEPSKRRSKRRKRPWSL